MAETIVLNDFSKLNYDAERKSKRFLLTFKAEPIVHNFDPVALGKLPADAIADKIRADIEAISAPVAPNTLRARGVAMRAFRAGKPWATKRYSGGRIGPMAPTESTELFNDSGRLAASVKAFPRRKDGEGVYIVNVAANRFDGRTLDNGGDAAMPEIFRRLSKLVPALASPEAMLRDDDVRAAIDQSIRQLILKENDTANRRAWTIARKVLGLLRRVDGL